MITFRETDNRKQIEMNALDDLVPKDHLLRKVDATFDFNFIYDEVRPLYSENEGRPSIDPVVLFKIVMIQYMFGISSMRQTVKEIQVNVAYRWFINYGLTEKIPHYSTFSKNYERRFKGSNVFNNIFARILSVAEENNLIHPEQVFIDATHVKASANKKKYKKVEVEIEARKYQEQLDKEISKDRELHGKKPLKEVTETKKKLKFKAK